MRSTNRNSGKKEPAENNIESSIPKGYRLKPETHELVEMLALKINGTKDQVISRACRMFESSVNRSKRNKYKD